MKRYATLALALVIASLLGGSETRAQQHDPFPWCADYGFGGLAGARNCYFKTLGQCQATVSGVGGYCVPNPFYTGPDRATPAQRSRSR